MDSSRNTSRNRLYWFLAIAAAVLAVAFIFLANESFYRDYQGYFTKDQEPPHAPATARLTIDFGDGRRRAFEGEVAVGMTALSALRTAQAAGSFSLAINQNGEVNEIGGLANSGGRKWRAYRNGALLTDVPGHAEVAAGDRIIFRYE